MQARSGVGTTVTGLEVLLATLGVSVALGLLHRSRDGRLRPARVSTGTLSTSGPSTSGPSTGAPSTGGPSIGAPSTGGPSTSAPSTGGPSSPVPGSPVPSADPADLRPLLRELGQTPGERATLVQFSSAFCAPCRATRRILSEVTALVPGVAHIEIDAESQLALVRQLGILKTPTTLVLDATGREIKRASGAPRKADVIAAVGSALPSST